MNNSIKYILTFSAGAAIGAFASWKYLKKKYDELLQEEIDYVTEEITKASEIEAKAEMEQYEELRKDYITDSEEESDEVAVAPYVITPEEFGEIDEFDTTTLYYYADGVLVTLSDEIVEDVESTVGLDFHEHFGEFEDDSVFIRNKEHMCDYEILKDSRKYSDVKKPIRPSETEE